MKLLHEYSLHHHTAKNVNDIHKDEIQQDFNAKLAVKITQMTGTMLCAYAFAFLAILGFPLLKNIWGESVAIYIVWISQTFIQLTMLPIISVGQSILSRHSEIMAEEQFRFTEKSYHDIEQIIEHLSKQDEELLKQTKYLINLLDTVEKRKLEMINQKVALAELLHRADLMIKRLEDEQKI